jgi:hypothetical protein
MIKIRFQSYLVTFFSAFFFMAAVGSSLPTQAQDSGRSPQSSQRKEEVDPEREKLEREVEKLRLRKEISELRKDTLNNSLPAASSQAIDGSITISGSSTTAVSSTFESQILAYQALQETARALKTELSTVKGLSSLVIFDANVFQNVEQYQAYAYRYRILIAAYRRELGLESGPPDLTGLAIPTTVLRSVSDLLSLFRTETKISSFQLTLPDEALVAQLSAQFRADSSRTVRVFHPKVYTSNVNVILNQLKDIFDLKDQADKKVNDSKTDPAKKERLMDLGKKFDELKKDFLTSSETLVAIARGSTTAQLLEGEGSYILFFKTEGGGSNSITRNIFFGSRLRHSGGAVVNYILFDPNGEIVISDTLYYHTGYVRVRKNEPITNIRR